jgi:hypothetical protein
MSKELSAAEKVVEEFLINLMTERVMSMSTGVQASSMRGLQPFCPLLTELNHLGHQMKRKPSTGMI